MGRRQPIERCVWIRLLVIARCAECVRVRNHSSTCSHSPALRSSTHGDAWLQLQMCAEPERLLGGVKDKSWVVREPAGS